ncbi:MAG: D-glycero-D-manno-heptose 1,7-bisphosphate phosphatase [Planctomycetota bacterium]|jgi:D-glycero-D-manno-heptose 1,7-bisphosphate phosphatase
MLRPAVFLDRDGTINREVDYLSDPDDFELIPGVAAALRELASAGYALVIITNQSGVARGMLSLDTLDAIHARMQSVLATEGVSLDGIEFCPHHPDAGEAPFRQDCDCRKPAPGMLLRAAEQLKLDLATSWMVGDSLRDLVAGEAAGTRSILVRTGKGSAQEQSALAGGDAPLVVDDLTGAAALILAD